MAVQENTLRNSVSIVYMAESDKTVSVSLGTLSADGWDAQKAMNIVNALDDLAEYSKDTVRHTVTSRLMSTD